METIVVERASGVVTVTLNRPERLNALTATMWEELGSVFADVAASSADRVLVVTGAGGAFCSGADLSSLATLADRPVLAAMRRVGDVAVALHRMPKPTIARVDGVAAGAGANLALACDLVVASERSRFCEIFAKRGLSVDFAGSWLLPRLVGLHRAKELVLLADMLSAREAAAMGLLNRVVADDELDTVVDDWAARLAAGPPIALSMSKLLLNTGLDVPFEQAVEAEAQAQAVNAATADLKEALAAYAGRRAPSFEGR